MEPADKKPPSVHALSAEDIKKIGTLDALQTDFEHLEANTPDTISVIADLNRVDSVARGKALVDLWQHYQGMDFADSYWSVFLMVYNSCDAVDRFKWIFHEALTTMEPCRPHLGEEETAFYDSLPELITVYRGFQKGGLHGLSWTTDEAVAVNFAQGNRGVKHKNPMVAKATVPKEAVLAVFSERSEREVLVDFKRLTNVSWRKLPRRRSKRKTNSDAPNPDLIRWTQSYMRKRQSARTATDIVDTWYWTWRGHEDKPKDITKKHRASHVDRVAKWLERHEKAGRLTMVGQKPNYRRKGVAKSYLPVEGAEWRRPRKSQNVAASSN